MLNTRIRLIPTFVSVILQQCVHDYWYYCISIPAWRFKPLIGDNTGTSSEWIISVLRISVIISISKITLYPIWHSGDHLFQTPLFVVTNVLYLKLVTQSPQCCTIMSILNMATIYSTRIITEWVIFCYWLLKRVIKSFLKRLNVSKSNSYDHNSKTLQCTIVTKGL